MAHDRGSVSLSFLVLALLPGAALAAEESWHSIGPAGMPLANGDVESGQINAIAVHPLDANILYAGAAEGGVWRSGDGGATWVALADLALVREAGAGGRRATLAIGALALDPEAPERVYAGTGNPNSGGPRVGSPLGVFASRDGGVTWGALGVPPGPVACENGAMSELAVNRLVVRADTPPTVFAATSLGVYRYREDGRDCWERAEASLPAANAIDLVLDRSRGTLFAGVWGWGIYRSADGVSWKRLTDGLPASGFGRLALAISRSDGRRLWAGFDQGGTYHLYRTQDFGETWKELPTPPSEGQLWFNNALAVDRSELPWVGQVGLWRGDDGGITGGTDDYDAKPPLTDRSWTPLSCCLYHKNPFRRGLDLHADVHDIVFAAPGSFASDPSRAELVFVATDGGLVRGVVNDVGVVTWQPLTSGLAVGQSGTLGQAAADPEAVSLGLWHNGDALTTDGGVTWKQAGAGDGFQSRLDAASVLLLYRNTNALDGGQISRRRIATGLDEQIWPDGSAIAHWTDPYRAGHLLRLQNDTGLLYRHQNADDAAAAELRDGATWELVEPPGKSGRVTTATVARRPGIDELPLYYLGTDAGEVWRGSPEVPWQRVCACGRAVQDIAIDLADAARIVVGLRGDGPGRVRELVRDAVTGDWRSTDLDTGWVPEVRVGKVTAVAIDPGAAATVFVGTDVGIYRARRESGTWFWSRSPGMPYVEVMEIGVHQRFIGPPTGIVRAATYGRGAWELGVVGPIVVGEQIAPRQEPGTVTLAAEALLTEVDGGVPSLALPLIVHGPGGSLTAATPFRQTFPAGAEVTLELRAQPTAPDGAVLELLGWVIDGVPTASDGGRLVVVLSGDTSVLAYYRQRQPAPQHPGGPLEARLAAAAESLCQQSFSHRVNVAWQVLGGEAPARLELVVRDPAWRATLLTLRPRAGSAELPFDFPCGGAVQLHLLVTDAAAAHAAAFVQLELPVCPGD